MKRLMPDSNKPVSILASFSGTGDALKYLSTGILNSEEKAKFESYRFPADKARFLKGRALIKSFISEHFGIRELSVIGFEYGKHGKPGLGDIPVNFNISHSGDAAVVVVSSRLECGIDIESKKSIEDAVPLSKRFFAGDEADHIMKCGDAVKSEEFLKIWTAKESYIKSTGLGVSAGLQSFSVLRSFPLVTQGNGISRHKILRPALHGDYICSVCIPDPEANCDSLAVSIIDYR